MRYVVDGKLLTFAEVAESRSDEFKDLTSRKAWTADDVRRMLPVVPVLMPGGIAEYGVVSGRQNKFASVRVSGPCVDTVGEFAWETIAHCLNNSRAVRF